MQQITVTMEEVLASFVAIQQLVMDELMYLPVPEAHAVCDGLGRVCKQMGAVL